MTKIHLSFKFSHHFYSKKLDYKKIPKKGGGGSPPYNDYHYLLSDVLFFGSPLRDRLSEPEVYRLQHAPDFSSILSKPDQIRVSVPSLFINKLGLMIMLNLRIRLGGFRNKRDRQLGLTRENLLLPP